MDNGKVYIGQTIQTLKHRLEGHMLKVNNMDFKDGTVHSDIHKYGLDNFMIYILKQCEFSKLNDRERYWINYYDGFNTGYNNTRGGGGHNSLLGVEDTIVEMGKAGRTLTEIASYIGCSLTGVKQVLEVNGIEYKRDVGCGPLKVMMYDRDWNIIRLWDSISQS